MYRPEYPRPSFVRDGWENLNGQWDFAIGSDDVKPENVEFDKKIEVPFCPESKLSGIQYTDFMSSVWYRREFEITEQQLDGTIFMNFGAADYITKVYVNGSLVGTHKGGYTSFSYDITKAVTPGTNTVVIQCLDDTRSSAVPSGKQSGKRESYACLYTRTTGIWQTVWLEFVGKKYIYLPRVEADQDKKTIKISGKSNNAKQCVLLAQVFYKDEKVGENRYAIKNDSFNFTVDIDGDIKLWGALAPEIYDITFTLFDGDTPVDVLKTYTAFRKFEIKNKKFYLNDKPIFLRQILDQGFYPDGIYTAPTLADIEKDIDIAISFGFNGARPHEKVFEENYIYLCDMKGYLIWGEYPNWGCTLTIKKKNVLKDYCVQWMESVTRDVNHPSIIGWCPLNEVWDGNIQSCDYQSQELLYRSTKHFDPSRPCIGSSGGILYVSDVADYHDYAHTPEDLSKNFYAYMNGQFSQRAVAVQNKLHKRNILTAAQMSDMPIFLSEYGGRGYSRGENSWAYVSDSSEDEYVNNVVALTDAIVDSGIAGLCYTQLTDVEQEQNGLVTYSREMKISDESRQKIYDAMTKKAKCEEE